MAAKYNFKATLRMYKSRLQKWGVAKNVTSTSFDDLMKKVEDSDVTGTMAELDPLKVKAALRYAKRQKSEDPKRLAEIQKLLDIQRVLSVDGGKTRSGRAKISIPTMRLEKQQSSPSNLVVPCSPPYVNMGAEGLPDDMTQLLQAFVNEEFHTISYPYNCSPMPFTSTPVPAPTVPWQSERSGHSPPLGSHMAPSFETMCELDATMLDFTVRLRHAHILLDDAMAGLAQHLVKQCLNTLSSCLQQTYSTDSRATSTVLLYALSAALEMAVHFDHLKVLHMLFDHINAVCAGQHPTMAEIAGRMPQFGRGQQISMLKLTRQMISRASLGYPGSQMPGFELYSRAVDISISHSSAERKLQNLCALSSSPNLPRSAYLRLWLDARIATAVCDAPSTAQKQGIWDPSKEYTTVFSSLRDPTQIKKILVALSYMAGRMQDHRMAGDWSVAERMASDLAWFIGMVWGHDNAVARRFQEDAENMKSPGLEHTSPVSVSLPPPQAPGSMESFAPIADLEMVHEHPEMSPFVRPTVGTLAGPSSRWDQTTPTTQGQYHPSTLPASWNTGNVNSSMGNGVDIYGAYF